jgi:hypothetical protein
MMKTQIASGLTLTLLAGILSACNVESLNVSTVSTSQDAVLIERAADPNLAVCNPTGGGSGLSNGTRYGLHGELKYIAQGTPNPSNVAGYSLNGRPVAADVFFDRVFVPTRPWNAGFQTLSGHTLQNDLNDTLFEYFSLHFESNIVLSDSDQPGLYQFALLSDDGSILRIKQGETWQDIVNDDGTHPSKFACASSAIEMTTASKIPMKLDWYQGPRYHISLIMLWRKVEAGTTLADSECGRMGNSRYFNSTQNPPISQTAWHGLMDRGWKPLNSRNFILNESAPTNPCTDPNGGGCQGAGCMGGFGV